MKVWAVVTNSPRISEPEVIELHYHSSDGETARVSHESAGPRFNYADKSIYRTKEQAVAAWTEIHKAQYRRKRTKKEPTRAQTSNRTKN